ncbi:exodeoxyribonuclease VII large subunit [Thalassotalea sp. ND16A]|uniref:exodeoxyribonuclease VII large subunit n=1 Tax=Thalassotalea sp. ND16A TaxID=1535422 RepID=UPI00051A7AA5|nr:exodeoxyribonuclease VII large subunit [Thalassotalea sp. ND16A]KGJ89346.1 Exodeoxyribonuclease VII [Thalassotalea sp. ND16A]
MTHVNAPQQHILQVSELTKKVRFILESELRTLWLCGEISNFIAASSGHWYLSLKDSKAQVRCAMFKGNNRYTRIRPQNGQQVLVKAKVSLYEPRGDFQLIIEQMEDAGDGLLRQKFELLKNQLQAEGLFDQRYKQPLPDFVKTVGIVTSSTGAAVQDILTVLKRRNPSIEVIIYPTLVQGDAASELISDAIYDANERDECDVLIVGRGGGSLEDLWAFNEEPVVRAIFDCDIPVISAVGHEVDTALADYVADMRAPTPSAAAELVSDDNQHLLTKIQHYRQKLVHLINHKLQRSSAHQQLLNHKLALTSPEQQLRGQQQKADDLHARLLQSLNVQQSQLQTSIAMLQQRLMAASPKQKIHLAHSKLDDFQGRLVRGLLQCKDNKQQQLARVAQNLNIVSPLATIARGYSITRDSNGRIIRSLEQVAINQTVTTQIADGQIESVVTNKQYKATAD